MLVPAKYLARDPMKSIIFQGGCLLRFYHTHIQMHGLRKTIFMATYISVRKSNTLLYYYHSNIIFSYTEHDGCKDKLLFSTEHFISTPIVLE